MIDDFTSGNIRAHQSLLMYFDGGCEPVNPGGTATSGWVIYDNESQELLAEGCQIAQDGGPLATNNYGEWFALSLALGFLVDQEWAGTLLVKADSKLVVNQVTEEWKCKAKHLQPLKEICQDLLEQLDLCIQDEKSYALSVASGSTNMCCFQWVRRNNNERANDLARKAFRDKIRA